MKERNLWLPAVFFILKVHAVRHLEPEDIKTLAVSILQGGEVEAGLHKVLRSQ